jgi:F-type H+-transporting ATPase subunit a
VLGARKSGTEGSRAVKRLIALVVAFAIVIGVLTVLTVSTGTQGLGQKELQKEILHTWSEGKEAWKIPIEVGGVDLSIAKPVWFLFIGAVVTFLILFIGSRVLKDRPGAYQVIVEELYGFGRKYLAGQMGQEGMRWFPYTFSLFVFLLVLNLIGLVPGSYPVTSNLTFTLVLAVVTLIIYNVVGIRRNGFGTYFGSFVPPNMPFKPVMVPFMFFTEALQVFITRPLTLAVRLYANILAGHMIIFVFLGFILFAGTWLAYVSVPVTVVFYAFEIFVAVIQAYIFAILTQIYIELAMYAAEEH